jgi:hypothetical protein
MGMDYVGKDGSTFHLNWSGHAYMYSLLSQLGANLTEWSGSNDGEYISSRTCKKWASLLKNNIERIKEIRIPDNSYVGGFQHMPLVEGNDVGDELAVGITGQLLQIENIIARAFGNEEKKVDPRAVQVIELPEGTKQWILDFASFLEKCNGCYQR